MVCGGYGTARASLLKVLCLSAVTTTLLLCGPFERQAVWSRFSSAALAHTPLGATVTPLTKLDDEVMDFEGSVPTGFEAFAALGGEASQGHVETPAPWTPPQTMQESKPALENANRSQAGFQLEDSQGTQSAPKRFENVQQRRQQGDFGTQSYKPVWSGTGGKHVGLSTWLTSKQRFLAVPPTKVTSPESFTFVYANPASMLARITSDVMDFMTVHLSFFTRALRLETVYTDGQPWKRRLLKKVEMRMASHNEELSRLEPLADDDLKRNFLDRTIVLLPFVGRPFESRKFPEGRVHDALRDLMLNATFLSVVHYFQHVLLATCDATDARVGGRLGRPLWKIAVLESNPMGETCGTLYRWSLRELHQFLLKDEGAAFDFIYATEADCVLHLQNIPQLLQVIQDDPKRVLAGHRLNAVVAFQDIGSDPDLPVQLRAMEARWQNVSVSRMPLQSPSSCCQTVPLEMRAVDGAKFVCLAHLPQCVPIGGEFNLMRFGDHGLPFMSASQLAIERTATNQFVYGTCTPFPAQTYCKLPKYLSD